jgi:RNA polymerase sigma-70 factor (ECF subfamily)
MSGPTANELLAKALQGDAEALGALLQRYRPYLRVMAQRRLDSGVQARVDPSDVVQQTCLEAHRDLARFQGADERTLIAWLRRILENNLAQTVQTHVLTQKRTTERERSLDAARSGNRALAERLPADGSSPSQRAMRGESAICLAQAMEALPPDQHEALRLRYLEGWPLAQIAKRMDRSEIAVAGLLKRGLRGLRKRFVDSP